MDSTLFSEAEETVKDILTRLPTIFKKKSYRTSLFSKNSITFFDYLSPTFPPESCEIFFKDLSKEEFFDNICEAEKLIFHELMNCFKDFELAIPSSFDNPESSNWVDTGLFSFLESNSFFSLDELGFLNYSLEYLTMIGKTNINIEIINNRFSEESLSLIGKVKQVHEFSFIIGDKILSEFIDDNDLNRKLSFNISYYIIHDLLALLDGQFCFDKLKNKIFYLHDLKSKYLEFISDYF